MESQEGLTRIVSLEDINIEDIVSDIGTLTEQILNEEDEEEDAGTEEIITVHQSDVGHRAFLPWGKRNPHLGTSDR